MKQQMPRPQAELLAENDTGKRYKVVSQSLPEQREFSTAESNPNPGPSISVGSLRQIAMLLQITTAAVKPVPNSNLHIHRTCWTMY